MEDDKGKIAEWRKLDAVSSWYNVLDGIAVAFKLVFVWIGLLSVLPNELKSGLFSEAKGDFDRVGTVVAIEFIINFWSFDLFTVGKFWIGIIQ